MMLKYLIVFFFCSSSVFASEDVAEAKTKQEIVNLLKKWSQDFNAKNIQSTCGLFAPDLVASYPGIADKNYEEMCQFLTAALTNKNKNFFYEMPAIQEILIHGDIVVVRLIWTLKITEKNRSNIEVIKEKGLDVFKRQKNGNWRIAISYAYPDEIK